MLKVALINGSPKAEGSNSQHIIDELKEELKEDCRIEEIPMHTGRVENPRKLFSCSVWVFVFPLYVDAVPSHLLRCLQQLESYMALEQPSVTVYAVVQNGFYEAEQNQPAMEMMENWCARCYLNWGMGVGVGGGGMLTMLDQKHNFCMLNIEETLGSLAECILEEKNAPVQFAEPNLPRKIYHLAAEKSLQKTAKANGLTREDLRKRAGED